MATGTFYDAWGPTATTTDSANRYHQNHLKVTWSSDNDKVVYTINAYARSGNGSGYHYASLYGVTVTLYYSLNGGGWVKLGSASGTLNYNDNVANITKTLTINRTHSSQTIKFAADNTGNSLNSVSHQTSNDTMAALASYTVSYNANRGSGAPGNQTKWYNENLTLSTTKPTRTNYTFKGWATSSTSTTVAYNSGATYTGNAALTLYAVWSLDYVEPTIGNVTVIRCNSSGQEQADGTYAKVSITWSTDSNYAGSKCDISYKESSASSYGTAISVTLSGNSGTVKQIINGNFDVKKSYSIKAVLTDTHSGTDTAYGGIPVCFKFLQFLSGGTGLAIGKYAGESNKIETTFPIKIQSTNITNNMATPSANITGLAQLNLLDSADNYIGFIRPVFTSSGMQRMAIFDRREINNTTYWNGFNLAIDSNGNPNVGFDRTNDKRAWLNALEPDILFEGSAIPNAASPYAVTLSSSAANYNHMRIYYKYYTDNKPEASVEIYKPNGKYVNLYIAYAGLNSGLYWPAATDIYINGTTITRRYSFYASASTTTQRTTTGGDDTKPISILRVEAWNDEWWG